jgi:hypothetical protein
VSAPRYMVKVGTVLLPVEGAAATYLDQLPEEAWREPEGGGVLADMAAAGSERES